MQRCINSSCFCRFVRSVTGTFCWRRSSLLQAIICTWIISRAPETTLLLIQPTPYELILLLVWEVTITPRYKCRKAMWATLKPGSGPAQKSCLVSPMFASSWRCRGQEKRSHRNRYVSCVSLTYGDGRWLYWCHGPICFFFCCLVRLRTGSRIFIFIFKETQKGPTDQESSCFSWFELFYLFCAPQVTNSGTCVPVFTLSNDASQSLK